jgi:hypothetical protein
MSRLTAPLSDTIIRNAKPKSGPYKLFDGEGLFVLVTPAGGKLWRLKYRLEGKEKLLSLGAYPSVKLKEARRRRDDAKEQIAQGIDPGAAKQEAKAAALALERAQSATFEAVAREWYAKKTVGLSSAHQKKTLARGRLLCVHVGSF